MKLKNKFTMGVSVILVTSILLSGLAFASPVSTSDVYLSTPWGQMHGLVAADCDNGGWWANTDVPSSAPVIYVNGQCQNYDSGSVISSKSQTNYNTNYASASDYTGGGYRVRVYGTHEVRGQSSYVKYNVVSQTL